MKILYNEIWDDAKMIKITIHDHWDVKNANYRSQSTKVKTFTFVDRVERGLVRDVSVIYDCAFFGPSVM